MLRWGVVHASVTLIDAVLLNRENDKAAALVGIGVKVHVGLTDGINPAARNNVTREWQASCRIVDDRFPSSREVTAAFRRRWD